MGMTMTQKILAAHAGLDSVTAGQLIEAKLDVVMANDITGPVSYTHLDVYKRQRFSCFRCNRNIRFLLSGYIRKERMEFFFGIKGSQIHLISHSICQRIRHPFYHFEMIIIFFDNIIRCQGEILAIPQSCKGARCV